MKNPNTNNTNSSHNTNDSNNVSAAGLSGLSEVGLAWRSHPTRWQPQSCRAGPFSLSKEGQGASETLHPHAGLCGPQSIRLGAEGILGPRERASEVGCPGIVSSVQAGRDRSRVLPDSHASCLLVHEPHMHADIPSAHARTCTQGAATSWHLLLRQACLYASACRRRRRQRRHDPAKVL